MTAARQICGHCQHLAAHLCAPCSHRLQHVAYIDTVLCWSLEHSRFTNNQHACTVRCSIPQACCGTAQRLYDKVTALYRSMCAAQPPLLRTLAGRRRGVSDATAGASPSRATPAQNAVCNK